MPTFLKWILTFNTINCDVIINFDALNLKTRCIMTSQFPLLRNASNFRSFSKFQPPFAMATAPFCTVVTLSWCQSLVMTEGTEKIYLTQLFFNVYWYFSKVAITFSRITLRIARIKLRKFMDIWKRMRATKYMSCIISLRRTVPQIEEKVAKKEDFQSYFFSNMSMEYWSTMSEDKENLPEHLIVIQIVGKNDL